MSGYVSPNCLAGACSSCLYLDFACAHPCHVDRAARTVEIVPEPMIHAPNPKFEAMVEDRGEKLCLAAQPHTHSPAGYAPCEVHRHEARRGLMGQWIGQQQGVA